MKQLIYSIGIASIIILSACAPAPRPVPIDYQALGIDPNNITVTPAPVYIQQEPTPSQQMQQVGQVLIQADQNWQRQNQSINCQPFGRGYKCDQW